MTWFDEDQLTYMRNQVAMMLPGTAVISTSSVVNVGGRITTTWTAAGTVACRVDPLAQSTDYVGDEALREGTTELYRLTVPFDCVLDANTRVTYGGRDYEVVQVDISHSANVSKRAVISRLA